MTDLASYFNASPTLLIAFTVYFLVEQTLRYSVGRFVHNPAFRSSLRASFKEPVYYSMLLGAIVSLSSTPFCGKALWDSALFSTTPPSSFLSPSAEICLTSRAVLWIYELNRLAMYPQYVYHHLGSVVVFCSAMYLRTPEVLYLPFFSLISEVTVYAVWLLGAHRDLDEQWGSTGRAKQEKRMEVLRKLNVWVYSVTRIPSVPAMVYTIWLLEVEKRTVGGWSELKIKGVLVWCVFVLGCYSFWILRYLKVQWGRTKRDSEMKRAGIAPEHKGKLLRTKG